MSNSSPATLLAIDAGVATITLNRADSRNAMSAELLDSLGDSLAAVIEDPAVRVVVVTNNGPAFCAGADLKGKRSKPRHDLVGVLRQILDAPKPVVGRIAGHCMGGGVGLAAACDISIAAEDVRIGFTEVRLGLAPAIISVVCLPKMRPVDASELFLSGERITATRAAEVGLLTRVVGREELDDAVDETVGKLAAGGPNALAASKQLVATVPYMQRDAAFGWTEKLTAALLRSQEAGEGIAAFREKRDPTWVP